MARENMEEWATNATVVQETVRATVEAYAAGEITFPAAEEDDETYDSPVPRKTNVKLIRYAPSFSAGITGAGRDPASTGCYPYTAQILAEFLGWHKGEAAGKKPQDKLQDALNVLEHIDAGAMSESDFDGLTTEQTKAMLMVGRVESYAHDSEASDHRKRAANASWEAKKAKTKKTKAGAIKR